MSVGDLSTGDPTTGHGSRAGVVIVGSGIAGVSTAAALRASGYDGPLRLVGEEQHLPYRRPAVSKELVRGEKSPDQILIRPQRWYDAQRVDLVLGRRAEALDTEARVLTLDDGSAWAYDRLVLATGGRARSLGPAGDRVVTLRTAADALTLADRLDGIGSVLVVGAGLVGSEIAASLRLRGLEVTMLEGAAYPLARILPEPLAREYASLHTTRGAVLETGVSVAGLEQHGDRVAVFADDGRAWQADLVVVAIGLAPDLDLAVAAGLETDGGIVVDWHGRTSAPGVYAAGDVVSRPTAHLDAAYRGEHWQSAQNHGTAVGRAVAADLAGEEPEAFDEVPWAWSDQYEVCLQVTGWPDASLDMVLRGEPGSDSYVAFFLDGDRLRGAVGVGRPGDVRAARELISSATRVDVRLLAVEDLPLGETVVS